MLDARDGTMLTASRPGGTGAPFPHPHSWPCADDTTQSAAASAPKLSLCLDSHFESLLKFPCRATRGARSSQRHRCLRWTAWLLTLMLGPLCQETGIQHTGSSGQCAARDPAQCPPPRPAPDFTVTPSAGHSTRPPHFYFHRPDRE